MEMTKRRISKGWSKAELARRAGMHPTDVWKIEAGHVRAYPGQKKRIANALGASIADVFGEYDVLAADGGAR